ncbi:regulator of protein signaling domain-containing protein [Salix suchowensis]|nr:regulator of protein signaling domain-containing protein [Salix suchowensis]
MASDDRRVASSKSRPAPRRPALAIQAPGEHQRIPNSAKSRTQTSTINARLTNGVCIETVAHYEFCIHMSKAGSVALTATLFAGRTAHSLASSNFISRNVFTRTLTTGLVISYDEDTRAGRPFHRGTIELFGILMMSMQLSLHRQHFRSFPNHSRVVTYLLVGSIEEVDLGAATKPLTPEVRAVLSMYRGSETSDPLRIMTTTRTFTFSMTRDMARAIVQHFIDARLIENATDPMQTFVKDRGIYTSAIKASMSSSDSQRRTANPTNMCKTMQLQRRSEDDDIVITRPIIHALFRRSLELDQIYTQEKRDQDLFQKLHERSKGIVLKDFTSTGKQRRKHRCCFSAVSAMEWMCDFTSVVGREEAAEIAAQFCRFRLIALVSEDVRDEDAIVFTVRGSGPDEEKYSVRRLATMTLMSFTHDVKFSEGICVQSIAVYTVTDEGRQLLHWDATLLSTVIDSLKSKSSSSLTTSESTRVDHDGTLAERRSVKESNFNRLRYVLEKPMLRSLFREFLRGSYCEENLSFWLDVGDFKRKFAVTSSVKATLGLRQVLRRGIGHRTDNQGVQYALEPEHKSAFDTSQLQKMINQYESISASVFKTMALDSIPKFCESSTYIAAHNQLELEDSGSDIKFLTPSDETPDSDFSGIYIRSRN